MGILIAHSCTELAVPSSGVGAAGVGYAATSSRENYKKIFQLFNFLTATTR